MFNPKASTDNESKDFRVKQGWCAVRAYPTKKQERLMSGQKFRLVTRSDFDGLVCAVLLKHLDMIDDILFVHPKESLKKSQFEG